MPSSLFCKWGKNTSLLVGGISILLLIISCLWIAPEIWAKEYPVQTDHHYRPMATWSFYRS